MDEKGPIGQLRGRISWVMNSTLLFSFSTAMAGAVIGMLVAFASWHIGKLIVLSSIGLGAVALLLGRAAELIDELLELVERIFPGWKSSK